MDVTWVGGGCFRLRGRDATVLTDPHTSGIRPRSALPKADLVTLSDLDADPGTSVPQRRTDRALEAYVADGPGEYEVAGVYVHGVPAPGQADRRTTLFTFDVDGVSVGHVPELSSVPVDALLDELGTIHVLLIGVRGGDGFLSSDQIIKTVSRIEPNIVIPYGVDDAASPQAAWRLVARELHGADPVADGNLNANRRQLPDPVDVRLLERRN